VDRLLYFERSVVAVVLDNQIVIWGDGDHGLLILVTAAALAPASAVSIAERRLVFGDAAQATEDHFVRC
jgi:hypothetical protein